MNQISLRTSVHVKNETVIQAARAKGTDTSWLDIEGAYGMTGLTLHVKDDRDISRLIRGLEALRDLQAQPTPSRSLEVTITSENVQD